MDATMTCPVCAKKQRQSKLVPRQINFNDAIYLCSRKKCKYPEGYPWLLIKRDFKELQDLARTEAEDSEDIELIDPVSKIESEVDCTEVAELITSQGTKLQDYNNILNDLNSLLNQDSIKQPIQETIPELKDANLDSQVPNNQQQNLDDIAFDLENLLDSLHKSDVEQSSHNENSLEMLAELDDLLL